MLGQGGQWTSNFVYLLQAWGKSSSNQSPHILKAAKVSVATLEFSDNKDYSQDDVVFKAKSAKVFSASSTPNSDWNVNLGCLLSMTPFASSLPHLQPSKKVIQLADSSFINATHSGSTRLPIGDKDHLHPSLLVPSICLFSLRWGFCCRLQQFELFFLPFQ